MAFDSTTFASDFADLFGNFAEQQKEQNEKLVNAIEQLGSGVGAKKGFKEKALEFANEAQEKYLGGRPKTGPRMVKKAAIGVVIEDVSKKAASKLNQTPEGTEKTAEEPPKTKMGLLALLGGLLGAGAVGVIGSVFGKGAGAGVAAGLISKIGPMIFKPLKVVLKRLPIIGSLFSFYEAYENFKKGGIDNILLGLLDVAAGFAYAFPGVGTAIGLGIDVLSYFINKRVEEHKEGGSDTSWLGSMYDKVIDYLSETDQIKWMVELSDLFSVLWDDPGNLDNWYNFFTHIGGLGTGLIDMLMNFDKTVGTALGITDEKGEGKGLVAEIVTLVNYYVVDPLIKMITDAFNYVKEAIESAASAVTDTARNVFSVLTLGLVDDAEEAKAAADAEIKKEKEKVKEERDRVLYRHLIQRMGDPGSNEELQTLYDEILQDEGRKDKMFKAIKNRKDLGMGYIENPLEDFAVIGGEIVELPKTAIISKGRVQGFSGEDTVIGFKEGEALLTGITNLIDVGQQQLTVLREYLMKNDNNIIAPNTNNNSTYNFSVESGVTSFRKMVS